MTLVLVLFLFAAVNSASIFLNPQVPHGSVQHMPSNAPSTEYMSLENLLGSAVTSSQDQVAVHLKEKASETPSLKNADTEPYLVSGPVVEYEIQFGLDIPGIHFTDESVIKPALETVKIVPVPEVFEYSILPKETIAENVYKIDDGHIDIVTSTYVTDDSLTFSPVNKDPVASLINTVIEQFTLIPSSKRDQNVVSLYDQTPIIDPYAVPSLADIPESNIYMVPEPVALNSNLDMEIQSDNNPVLAISNMLKSFYKQEYSNLDEITTPQIVYNAPEQVASPVAVLTNVPIKGSSVSDDAFTQSYVAVHVPIVKTKTKLIPKTVITGKAEENYTDKVNIEVKGAQVVNQDGEQEEETVKSESESSNNEEVSERAEDLEETAGTEEEDKEAEAKEEGVEMSDDEENNDDEAMIKNGGEEEEKSEYSQRTKNEEDSEEEKNHFSYS